MSLQIITFTLFFVGIFIHLSSAATKTCETSPTNSPCGGSNWIEYKDEKCFKLIPTFATRNQAEAICNQEKSTIVTGPFIPRLASIKTEDEQLFIQNYLFESQQTEMNIWTSGQRSSNSQKFVWADGTELEYENWSPGSPSEIEKRDCIVIESGLLFNKKNLNSSSRGTNVGKWNNVICGSANYVLCEKVQSWSLEYFQKQFLLTRHELKETQNELDQVKQNPIPIGFIYVQLPGERAPTDIWPWMGWSDITSTYGGMFFRAEGGNSAAFGQIQEGNAPRLIRAQCLTERTGWTTEIANVPEIDWSNYMDLSRPGTLDYIMKIRFQNSGGEVRPRNMAMKIWKRTA